LGQFSICTFKGSDKSLLFILSGLDIGVIVAFTLSGWLCTLSFGHGWPLIFYVFGEFINFNKHTRLLGGVVVAMIVW
jgi:hypothetical protein